MTSGEQRHANGCRENGYDGLFHKLVFAFLLVYTQLVNGKTLCVVLAAWRFVERHERLFSNGRAPPIFCKGNKTFR